MLSPVLSYNVGMSDTEQQEEKLFTSGEVARMLDLTPGRIRQMCISGEIQSKKVGHFWVISESEVEKARNRPRAWNKDKESEETT